MDKFNAFKTALEARRGKIKSESLVGAAAALYKDNTMSNADLEAYADPVKAERSRPTIQQHSTFKY